MSIRKRSAKEERFLDIEFSLYNKHKLNNKISELYRLFIRFEDVEIDIDLPRITTNYEIKYEQFIKGTKSSKVENFVFKKMYLESRIEEERTVFLSKFTLALKSLSKEELIIFDKAFYEQKTDIQISIETNFCEKTIRKLRNSSYIRLLTALGIDQECFNDWNNY